ncbi:hypothetical protein [Pseudalkalibacillus sp. JSM 102089]|uniref:hypothetical protein n=1 Tax=Pseudalkalibacillus sp. JSM 102089 TaxID=3229856 RepID=UPI0035244A3D
MEVLIINSIREIFSSKWFGYPLIFGLLFGAYAKYGVIKIVLSTILVALLISMFAYNYKHNSLYNLVTKKEKNKSE